ncbi:MAG TPA: methyl-accepting chemotaxis protein [Ktedonobacterales bacterium]|nr:methyl-accepting chemotaxis protein [Ktedonobacterales bacterium]
MRSLIRARMLGLAEVFGQATAGDRSLRAVVVGDDEFATLATAFNSLIDSGGGGSGSGGGTGEIQDAAALQSQIEKLLQEVSAVGDGDLRVQAEVTPDTLGVLADSFNYMIEELAKVVGRVQATTLQVTNATRRLLDRSAEVAQASEAQSAQISQTSEAVAQLANFVSLSARNALTASDTAQEALRNAQLGQTAVVQTIDGMVHIRENVQETSKRIKRLGERSQEVGEIVRLIEDIADQTNLLALNAAIQSAMAGEHGRGFAVVADEIRLLAERSTEATKRIATIVKSIQGDTYEAVVAMEESTQEVVNGSRLADEAGQALQSIFVAVERQAQTIEGIAHAAAERAPTSEAVATAMNRISEITRQTNAATQDAASSVSYLAELAEQLRASVAAFRLPERAAEAPALPMPPDNGFAQGLNLPNLGSQGWNGQADYPLPALPAAGGMSNFGGMPDYNGGAAPNFGAMPAYGNGSMPDYHGGAVPDFGAMPDYNAGGGAMPGYAGGAMPDYNNGAMPDYNNGAMPDYNNGAMPNFAPGYYPPLNGDQARPEYPGQPFPTGPAGRPRTSGESY